MSQKTIEILRECIPTFNVLSDENRLMILHILFENGNLNVGDITERLHLSRPAVSHHLKIMLDAGLVSVIQQGKERYYTATLQQAGERFCRLMASFIEDGCIKQ